MKYFFLMISFLSMEFITAQDAVKTFPVFPECKEVSGIEQDRCFYSSLYKALYKNLDPSTQRPISSRDKVAIYFEVNKYGAFVPVNFEDRNPSTFTNAIKRSFNKLPVIQAATFMQQATYRQFLVVIRYPMKPDGSFDYYSSNNQKEWAIEYTGNSSTEEVEEIVLGIESGKTEEKMVDIPFAIVEQIPLFPECEELQTYEEQKKCVQQEIKKFVDDNFDNGLAKELGLKGLQKVIVQFKIDTNGTIVQVQSRASHPKLKEHAIEVTSKMPKMIPGTHQGRAVTVIYALPIIFQVTD